MPGNIDKRGELCYLIGVKGNYRRFSAMVYKTKRFLALILVAVTLLGAGAPQVSACCDILRQVLGREQPGVTALDTPLLGQNKDNWCWAASSLMAARTYVNTGVTQTDIVKHVKGSAINEGGTVWERLEAVYYATGGAVEFDWVPPLSEAAMVASIDAGDPVMLCRGWYPEGYPGYRYGGHSTVLYGYRVMDDGSYMFLVRDPWPPNRGASEVLSYVEICRGSDTGILEMCEVKI